MDTAKTREVISKIYEEKKDFIIIGLTGRTGSGCTTVSELLSKDFETIKLPKPLNRNFVDEEDRKYNIVYNYALENWRKFQVISMRTIITSFILERNFDEFIVWISYLNLKEHMKRSSKNENEKEYMEKINKLEEKFKEFVKKLKTNENLISEFNMNSKFHIEYLESLKRDKPHDFNIYYKELLKFSDIFTKELSEIDRRVYTLIYQIAGNNIRTSGKYYDANMDASKVFSMIDRVNDFIKCIRKENKQNGKETLIVIDAIRNPYEAMYLRERYSAFYLFSINTDDNMRKSRLIDLGLTKEEILELDDQEYPKKDEGIETFVSQDIQSCLELSDVHLNNPDNSKKEVLKKDLVRYISLIMNPGIISPTDIERCMQIAYTAKLNSGCLSRQVGAVLTDDEYYLRAMGWNDTPSGQVPCNLRSIEGLIDNLDECAYSSYEYSEEFQSGMEDYLKDKGKSLNHLTKDEFKDKLKGRCMTYCFKDVKNYIDKDKNQVHTRSLHAEENAILMLSKFGGENIENGCLFVTASPCELCSKKVYHLGVKKVYYIDPYPGISSKHVLDSGSRDIELILFKGAVGKAFHQLFTQVMPIKDELNMLTGINFKR